MTLMIGDTLQRRNRSAVNILLKLFFLLALAAVLVYGGMYAWQRWQIYQDQQFAINVDQSNPVERQKAEGKDETKPREDLLKNYKVAADQPRALYIDKLDVAARILPMGLNIDKSIQAPINIFDSGWYTSSAKPGDEGAVFIDAHASGPTRQGLFAYLDTVTKGDQIRIERGDGQVYKYEVVATETVPLDTIDMKRALAPHAGVKKGANFITCTGAWLQSEKTFDKRVIVYTKQLD